jgi:hypothetical protein
MVFAQRLGERAVERSALLRQAAQGFVVTPRDGEAIARAGLGQQRLDERIVEMVVRRLGTWQDPRALHPGAHHVRHRRECAARARAAPERGTAERAIGMDGPS